MTADERYSKIMQNPRLNVEGRVTGEGFCWHAAFSANDFVTGYLAFQDTEYLDRGVDYFDWLTGLLETGPDGYQGWIGPYMYDPSVWCDVHVGDAILFNPMLRFAEAALDGGRLQETYGPAANRYVELARKHLMEKWDARGTWNEDGPYGAYVSWDRYMPPGDLSEWRALPITKSTLSLPFNKQNDMGIAALRLYRLTGEAAYRERAERIFLFMKSRFRFFDDHYVWNYWEPAGQWDMDPDTERPRHWVNVHPYRNYQAGEVHDVVEAYHSGVVFDETDIRRILNTNLRVMWNGDLEDPQWRNSNESGPWQPPSPPKKGEPEERAGALWSGLIDFDSTARQLYERSLRPESLAHAYYHRVTAQAPPGFDRKYVDGKPGGLPEVPFSECRDLTMAAALPSVVRPGKPTLLLCKTPVSGKLEIALRSPDGTQKTLYTTSVKGNADGSDGFVCYAWDGRDAGTSTGEYCIRWMLNGEYREFPVTVGG